MNGRQLDRGLTLHLGVIGGLIALQFLLPAYHHGIVARVLVLASFALGYNILFGYTGLLSLGHALFFGAGVYGAGMVMREFGWPASAALVSGIVSAALVSLVVGFLALRTVGVAFMIVTLMFAQAGYLTSLFFNRYTRGDEGFVIPQAARAIGPFDLSEPATRYFAALLLFAICVLIKLALVRSSTGRILVSIRENEERSRMLGYNTGRYKLLALVISGAFAGAAGAVYALLFGYVGATFLSIQYSIFPLLWVLLGGAGTVLGPLVGTLIMFYLVDLTSGIASASLLAVGVVLVILVLWFPKGVLGAVRQRALPWLP